MGNCWGGEEGARLNATCSEIINVDSAQEEKSKANIVSLGLEQKSHRMKTELTLVS